MRYADVLLMMAEACVQTGDQAKADECVKIVRGRARLSKKSGVTLDDVKLERRLELSMEGVRFQDLKRWRMHLWYWQTKGKNYLHFILLLMGIMIYQQQKVFIMPNILLNYPILIMKKQLQGGPLIAMNIYHFRKMNWK